MKAACFSGVQKVDVCQLSDPQLVSDSDAIVRITTAGLCGSDLHPYHGREKGIDLGTVLGHEFVGEVISVGAEISKFRSGDRVCAPFTTNCGNCSACKMGLTARCTSGQLFGWREGGVGLHGGQATHVRVPLADSTLMRVPEGLTDEIAILLGDNLTTSFFATDLASVSPNQSVAIIGCGTVGLLAVQWCVSLGVQAVFALEPNANRREMASSLGALTASSHEEFCSTIQQHTSGFGVDSVLELVGLPAAQRTAYEVIRPGGTLATIGCHCTPHFSFTPSEAYDKNLNYRTGRCPARFYMESVHHKSVNLDLDLSWCVTHRFSLDQAQHAYDIFANRKEGCIKAVFTL